MPGFDFEKDVKQKQSVQYKKPDDGSGFHAFVPPKLEPSYFDKKFIKSTIAGMNDLMDGKGYPPGSVISFVAVPKAGKAQPLDNKIFTPNGWIEMKNAKIGTKIIGSDGHEYSITGVYPQGEQNVYKITFSDKSSTQSTADHLWTVRVRQNRPWKTVPLSSIIEILSQKKESRLAIPMVEPIEFSSSSFLNINPYLLGLLIGDGGLTGSSPMVSTADPIVISEISSILKKLQMRLNQAGKYDFRLSNSKGHKNPISESLREMKLMGLHSYEKFIPKSYLYSDLESRISLLQGLLDSDGTVEKGGKYHKSYVRGISYTTTSFQLMNDFVFLVRSLGGTATVSLKNPHYSYKEEKRAGRLAYVIATRLPNHIIPFRGSRAKLIKQTKRIPIRNISSIVYIGKKLCQCIQTNAPDGLYITDDMIVTHNTCYGIYEAIGMSQRGDDVLYIYNESIQQEFMTGVDRYRNELGIDRKALTNSHLTFFDRHNKTSVTPNYQQIESFVDSHLLHPIEGWLNKHENPKLIVIDSLTKFIRKYPAQAFVFAEKMMYGIKDMFYKLDKFPVVLIINQKSSSFDKKDDESVLGGMGIVHDMDGSFVIRTETVNKWTHLDYGWPLGAKMRIFRVEDLRLVDADTREHLFLKEKDPKTGKYSLRLGETLQEMNDRQESKKGK